MGVTKKTVKNMLLDAGVVYLNYGLDNERILGATSGGNTFNVEREIREIEVDGVKGKTKGLRRKISENAHLTVNLKEMSPENIQIAFSGSTIDTSDADYDIIKSGGDITDNDYLENVALVVPVSGSDKHCIILLHNVLSDESLDLNLEDENEGIIEVQLSAHYDPEDLDAPIYEIKYPKVSL